MTAKLPLMISFMQFGPELENLKSIALTTVEKPVCIVIKSGTFIFVWQALDKFQGHHV